MIEVPGPPHDRLATLSAALLHLHKSLLDSERAAYERDVARITSSGQYLQQDGRVETLLPMIQSRSILAETARKFGVGFFPGKGSMVGRIVFPLLENRKLVGYAGRATLEGQEPKWLLGKGLRKTFLFGLDRCDSAKPLVLVESPWAVLWLHQNGAQAAALMGSEMTVEQEGCLTPFGVITVALDNDAAGNEKAAPIVERLKAAGHKVLKARLKE